MHEEAMRLCKSRALSAKPPHPACGHPLPHLGGEGVKSKILLLSPPWGGKVMGVRGSRLVHNLGNSRSFLCRLTSSHSPQYTVQDCFEHLVRRTKGETESHRMHFGDSPLPQRSWPDLRYSQYPERAAGACQVLLRLNGWQDLKRPQIERRALWAARQL